MSFNLTILEGNLTRDPKLSYTPSQTAVVDFGVATNEKWVGQDGQKHEKVMFVDCVVFGKSAENINKYFHKGNPILIQGRLQLDRWTDKETGANRSKHKIAVSSWTFPLGKQAGAARPVGGPPSAPPDDSDLIPF